MVGRSRSARNDFVLALSVATLAACGLFVFGAVRNESTAYSYLLWNLFLAWLPLIFALLLTKTVQTQLWSAWKPLVLSLLWLIFLPNSFYMISDFIHLKDAARVDVLFDAVMFSAFIYTAVLLGLGSLYLVHLELKRRLRAGTSAVLISIVLFAASFAIYIGRDLRWNSWDVIVNPAGLLFDVSDRLLHPSAYPQMLVTVFSFFVLLGSMYILAWNSAKAIRKIP